MKNYIFILIILIGYNSFSQSKKETIYLFFDLKDQKKCLVEYGNGPFKVKVYRKEFKKGEIIFHICGEKFLSNSKERKVDTCSIKSLKKLNIKNLDYIQDKYKKGHDFKYHVFKQINIVEKISATKIVKYFDVYWCCEWTIIN